MFDRITSRRSFVTSAAVLALGGTHVASAQSSTPIASPSTAERVVEHVGGSTTLTGDPQRIVVLEWYLLEQLLAAGVQPVGVADIDGYESLVSLPVPDLAPETVDVGTRQEPSIESIAGVEPDLILADDGRHEAIYDQLSAIAPTILVPFDDRSDDVTPLDDLDNRVTLIGQSINRTDDTAANLASMEATLAEQRQRLVDAGLDGAPFAFASWYTNNTEPTLRMFSNQHIVGDAVAALGIKNVWPDTGEPVGFSTVGFEALVSLPAETHFIFVPTEDGGFVDLLENDPILTSLPFVQEGRAYGLAHDTWTNPGTVGVEVLVTRVADALTGETTA